MISCVQTGTLGVFHISTALIITIIKTFYI